MAPVKPTQLVGEADLKGRCRLEILQGLILKNCCPPEQVLKLSFKKKSYKGFSDVSKGFLGWG